ncbi:hypothetical protein LTR62_008259 [Meristemomyces frigidus]|uniref:Major facilitator superfamily (MFS) profile domain-containing protein n=1 Tax=Meristemomyces frigidus TaxID=1508187 RepID=A0AAN7T9Y1_9PEZI|nr:hypothetical protein LTR62_008259 [Meristemomyces frigidus]
MLDKEHTAESTPSDKTQDVQPSDVPIGLKLYLITLSLMLSVFCVALDNTIIATAIPRITDQFHALNDVGWYASAYLLTTCAFQLFFGKLYTLFNIKWTFLSALFIFELGSLVCVVGTVVPVHCLDLIGTTIFVPCVICLLLALQWGGTTYAWSDYRIIICFTFFAILVLIFVAVQWYSGDKATIPVNIALQRSIAFGSIFIFCLGSSIFIFTYYLPIWFQAIKGTSPVRSGIDNIPMILSNVVGITLSGGLTTRFGRYMPFIMASTVLMSIGSGLLTTLRVDTSVGHWVGYQIIYGFGVGLGFQQVVIAAQVCLPRHEISIGTAFVLFIQLLGGAIMVSAADNTFTQQLTKQLSALNFPNFDPEVIIRGGATAFRSTVTTEQLPDVVLAYNEALLKTFRLGLIMACLSILGAVGMEWKTVKEDSSSTVIV